MKFRHSLLSFPIEVGSPCVHVSDPYIRRGHNHPLEFIEDHTHKLWRYALEGCIAIAIWILCIYLLLQCIAETVQGAYIYIIATVCMIFFVVVVSYYVLLTVLCIDGFWRNNMRVEGYEVCCVRGRTYTMYVYGSDVALIDASNCESELRHFSGSTDGGGWIESKRLISETLGIQRINDNEAVLQYLIPEDAKATELMDKSLKGDEIVWIISMWVRRRFYRVKREYRITVI